MFNTIEEAIADIKLGKMVVVVDDENRENEGDLVMAADLCRTEDLNFMVTKARGLVCVPIGAEQAKRLQLNQMVENNTDAHGTAFTVSVDHMIGTTTGISAAERAITAKALADPNAKPEDFRRPGHIFPLVARHGGVLKRAGHTEAAVDLSRMAGLNEGGVICEIMNQDGSMARLPQLIEFAHEINIGSNVWIGADVIILPGVSIGDNTVIGAGSVVTKNIPSNVLAVGNPCKVIREISEDEE